MISVKEGIIADTRTVYRRFPLSKRLCGACASFMRDRFFKHMYFHVDVTNQPINQVNEHNLFFFQILDRLVGSSLSLLKGTKSGIPPFR